MWRRAPRKYEPEEEDHRDYRRSRGGSGAFPLYSEQKLVRARAVNGPPFPRPHRGTLDTTPRRLARL